MTESKRDVLADLALAAIVVIWVVSYLVFKFAFVQFAPHAFNLARFTLMIPLAFTTLWLSEGDIRLRREQLPHTLLSGLLGFGLYQTLFISGLAETQAANMALLHSTTPVFSAVLLTAFALEKLRLSQWLGVSASLVGVTVFLFAGSERQDGFSFGVGDLMALGSAACFAAYGVVNKKLMKGMTPVRLMAYGLLFGIIPLIPVSIPDVLRQDWASVSPAGWLLLAYATVFPVYLAYMLWNWSIARRGVIHTAPVSYLVPVFTGLATWVVLGERLTWLQIFAGAVVLAGVGLTRSVAAGDEPKR